MPVIAKEIISADCVVFASPIYYFGLCSQLKMVIDRFYAYDEKLHKKKKAVFLSAMADTNDETSESAEMQYHSIVNYFGWENCGVIIAKGCATIDDFYKADMIPEIYSLGLSI